MSKMNILFSPPDITEEEIEEVVDTLKSGWITTGPKTKLFEQNIAKFCNTSKAVCLNSATACAEMALRVLGIGPGDEVITSAYTYTASASVVCHVGAKLVLVDTQKDSYEMDYEALEEAITEKTKVITPVSLAGYPVDLKAIREIIEKTGKDIKIIHDAAHAIGALREGRNIIDYADVTILSFHPVKHVTTGEGGMVLTNSEEYYKKLSLFRTHGITRDSKELLENQGAWYYEMQDLGYNYRITDMQCALGITQMNKLNRSIYKRNQIAKFYEEKLKDIEWLKLPLGYFSKDWLEEEKYKDLKEKPENINSYHLFPILLENTEERKRFFDYMRENNIFVQVHYIPLHLMPYYRKKFGFKKGDFPVAENYYSREVSLPMYPTLTKEELEYIIKVIKEFKGKGE